jgi:hypothetical protein
MLYYNGEYVYTLDPTIPESAWYGQALNGEKDLSFNMSYDIGIKKMQLWINAIVKNGTVPVGITGTGITLQTILERQLPLPHMDLLPETLEEKVVCYADKFFSKTKLHTEKTLEQAEHSLLKFGEDTIIRFHELTKLFE